MLCFFTLILRNVFTITPKTKNVRDGNVSISQQRHCVHRQPHTNVHRPNLFWCETQILSVNTVFIMLSFWAWQFQMQCNVIAFFKLQKMKIANWSKRVSFVIATIKHVNQLLPTQIVRPHAVVFGFHRTPAIAPNAHRVKYDKSTNRFVPLH